MIALIPLAIVSPILTICFLLHIFDTRRSSPLLASLEVGLCLACAFYGLRLSDASDISRHMALLQTYARVDFFHCFNAGHYTSLYVWDIWCWFVSRLNNPYLLQSSAAFVGYSIISYIVFDYSERQKAGGYIVTATLIFGLCSIPFSEVFIGIRSTIALLLCALAAYRRFVCGDRLVTVVLLCLAACMIHQVSLLPIVLILIARPLSKSPGLGLVSCFFVAFSAAAICNFLLPSIGNGSNPVLSYLTEALQSFLGYNEGNEWTRTQASSFNTRINVLFTFMWIAILFVNVYLRRRFSLKLVDGEDASRISVVDALALASGAVMAGLSLILEVNGTRLVAFMFPLGLVALIGRMTRLPASSSRLILQIDGLVWVVCICLFALHAYSLFYDCQDLQAFGATVAFGVTGTLFG